MYVDIVPNRNSPPAILVRESRRVGKTTKKKTLMNISDWPMDMVLTFKLLLQGEKLIPATDAFSIEESFAHGHVSAVLGSIKKLGLDDLISSRPCRERDLVIAMIVQRLVEPCSKLATTRLWHTTTLAGQLHLEDADENELYEALDWLLNRKANIEKRLAARHLNEGSMVLYDVSSSYYEGHTCPLAQFGHNRDGKKGKTIIVYGVLTDADGRPVALDVFPGNTGDPNTVPDQVAKLRTAFGLERIVLVGDRGMLTQTKINFLKEYPGLGWISALRSQAIRNLMNTGQLQLSLFDERDLAEIFSPEFPGERLVACYNSLLTAERRRKRKELLAATEKQLEKIRRETASRTKNPLTRDEILRKVHRVANKFKMEKHFILQIDEGKFDYRRNEDSISTEEQLDGIYIIRTSEPAAAMNAEDTVRNYKRLAAVERAFRCLKGLDIRIRPIRHHTPEHVTAHIFLCMLAYYVEWHMRKSLAPFLFDDEQLDAIRPRRDPVKPAAPSQNAKSKKATHVTQDGWPVHSFETLMAELATQCKNRCRVKHIPDSPPFSQFTEPTPFQTEIFNRLGLRPVN
jgi:transposase